MTEKNKSNWLERFFEPRIDFFKLLSEQAETTLSGVQALQDWIGQGCQERCQLIRDLEHKADDQKVFIQECLVDTLVTPIDREDIYDLSARLDEVINSARTTVREIEAWNISSDDGYIDEMGALLVKGVEHLFQSFQLLKDNLDQSTKHAMKARKCENSMEKIYRKAMRDVLTKDDMKLVIGTVEIYRTMLTSAHRIEIVGEKLVHVIVKIR